MLIREVAGRGPSRWPVVVLTAVLTAVFVAAFAMAVQP